MHAGPFVTLDKQTVVGALKATGSRDLDVLYAARTKLIGVAGSPRWYGSVVVGIALLLAALPRTRIAAIPLLGLGLWLVRRGTRNVRIVEAGHAEYAALLRVEKPSPVGPLVEREFR